MGPQIIQQALALLQKVAPAMSRGVPNVNKVPNTVYRDVGQLISHEGAPDAARVAQYQKMLQQGKAIDPLKVISEAGKYGIEDGKHRLQALINMGYRFAPTTEMK